MIIATQTELSLTGKRWVLPLETTAVNASHVILRLLKERGIDPAQVPTLPSPFLYPDMHRAVERIERAIAGGERIGIFGDYDCDGVTAVAQVVRMLERRGNVPWVRLPHRVRDGYGLHAPIVQEVIDAGVTLLVTCDTGITAVMEVGELQKNGVDVIITDHHRMHEEVPPAFAILHPALSTMAEPHPSGAGVAFALISAMEKQPWNGMEEDLAIAMFGTIGDLVGLRGNNRSLVQLGLRALASIPSGRPIAALRERCSAGNGSLSAVDVAFRIAPRLNAAGRMAEPDIALKALLHGNESLAELDSLNEQRQALTRELYAKALTDIDPSAPFLFSVSNAYPHGILGLIAGKLTEQFHRPSLVAHSDGNACVASLRSPACYNISEALGRASDLLQSYGGHAQAAGCSFTLEALDALRSRLTEDVTARVKQHLLTPEIIIDAALDPRDITIDFCEKLKLLEPFGQQNAEPLFLLRGVALQNTRSCGTDGAHLQARISGTKCIGFHLGTVEIPHGNIDAVVRVGIDTWNGQKQPQLFIEDLRAV